MNHKKIEIKFKDQNLLQHAETKGYIRIIQIFKKEAIMRVEYSNQIRIVN